MSRKVGRYFANSTAQCKKKPNKQSDYGPEKRRRKARSVSHQAAFPPAVARLRRREEDVELAAVGFNERS